MKNIVVSIELDFNPDKIIQKAIELAKAFKAKIWLIHIAAPNPDFVGYEAGPQHIRDFRAKELKDEHKLLQKYTSEIEKEGIETDGLLIAGETVETIIEETKKLDSDLIIIGHHHSNVFYQIMFGKTSTEIISSSNIPVLVVPLD